MLDSGQAAVVHVDGFLAGVASGLTCRAASHSGVLAGAPASRETREAE
jgi:hypothetical protein